jgi:(p)ppGpp synthase/HD superfamily hydrolase
VSLGLAIERLHGLVTPRGLEAEWPRLERVLAAAWLAHDGQARRNGDPYVVHPVRVAEVVLVEWDRRDADLVCAALLHDTVEDTPLSLEEIDELAGAKVKELVFLLTKEEPGGYPDKSARDRVYFERLLAGPVGATIVKCADRADNLRDMAGSGWSLEKKREYIAEAREKILPLARERAPEAARALEAVAREVEAALA